jgi:hypothetical protein
METRKVEKEIQYNSLARGIYSITREGNEINLIHLDVSANSIRFSELSKKIAFLDNKGVCGITDKSLKDITRLTVDAGGNPLPPMKEVVITSNGNDLEVHLLDFNGNLYYSSSKPGIGMSTVLIDLNVGKIKEIYGRRELVFILTQDDYLYFYGNIYNTVLTKVEGIPKYEFKILEVGQVKKVHESKDILVETVKGEFLNLPGGLLFRNEDILKNMLKIDLPLKGEEIREFNGGSLLSKRGVVYTENYENWIVRDVPPVTALAGYDGLIYLNEAWLEFEDPEEVHYFYAGDREVEFSKELQINVRITKTRIKQIVEMGIREFLFIVG